MCGTGDINALDFKAHAVIVGGSWHFKEKVDVLESALFFPNYFLYRNINIPIITEKRVSFIKPSSFLTYDDDDV